MIFAFFPPCIARLIWDGCRKYIFFKFVGLDRKHGCVSKHIILKTNIYELLQKITNAELALNSFLCLLYDITSDINILSVT